MCTIEDCARIKLAELAMKEYGLLEDISYRTFLDSLERENQRREENLKRYYEKHKDAYYRRSDSIEVEKITLPYEEVADNVVSLVREESYEKWLDTAYREADLQIKNENVFKEVK